MAKPVPLKYIDKVKLYYWSDRNTATVAINETEARKVKKRGSNKLVAVRIPTDAEKRQLLKGVWVRTRRDGLPPHKSKYGKGRGQGPPRKNKK